MSYESLITNFFFSCEVSQDKLGGVVFFGDATRGHVLSHTFQIKDSKARGFLRLFSIIILMKDKLFLLNVQPYLSNHLEVNQELFYFNLTRRK